MINLLEAGLPAAEIAAVLREIHLCPAFPPVDGPEWTAIRRKPAVGKWAQGIRLLAETEALEPLPPLPDELYEMFFKTQERLPFERVYAARRQRLGRAAMTLATGDASIRQRFAPVLIRMIGEIMDEESWTLPAHAWTEPTGKDPFKIDLAAAETANLMGELLNLFGAIIPDDLKDGIRHRLHEQILENYLSPRSDTTWKRLPMNWNAVCHQGVIGAALALEAEPGLLAALLASAAECLRIFLGGFGADGSTSEGPGYWVYGFGRFAELNFQLETATGGAFSFFGHDEHIRRIAQFAPALVFSNGHLVNFSDGSHAGRLPPWLLAYLGERLDLPVLRQEGAAAYQHAAANAIDPADSRCDVYTLTRLFLRCPGDPGAAAAEPARPNRYFDDYGAVVARGTDATGSLLEFAAKAGHNAEHHNHNDCGSFLLNLNGWPAIIEIGAPEYVGPYFNSDATRYEFLAARSLGHSVPLVNGCEQAAGAEFAAAVLACENEGGRVKFVVDLTRCYPAAAGCRKLVRTFLFEGKAGRLQVRDVFELETPGVVESIIMSETPPVQDGGGLRLEAPGGALRLVPGEGTVFSGAEECAYNDRTGRKRLISRLRAGLTDRSASGEIILHISV